MVQMQSLNTNLIFYWRVCHAFTELKEASWRPPEGPWARATCQWSLVSSKNKPAWFPSGLLHWGGSLGVASAQTGRLILEQLLKLLFNCFPYIGSNGYSQSTSNMFFSSQSNLKQYFFLDKFYWNWSKIKSCYIRNTFMNCNVAYIFSVKINNLKTVGFNCSFIFP